MKGHRLTHAALTGFLAAVPLGCSHSASIDPTLQTGLNQVVQQAEAYMNVPSDPQTSKAAAQITELEFDRESQLGTASMLQASESDPSFAGKTAALETARQAALAKAASDLSQIQNLQGSGVPGKATLSTDGGAAQVVDAIIAKAFAKQAQAILNSGSPPSSDQISTFLQEVAIVTADQGAGGHDVAARLIARGLLSDAGLTLTDGATP